MRDGTFDNVFFALKRKYHYLEENEVRGLIHDAFLVYREKTDNSNLLVEEIPQGWLYTTAVFLYRNQNKKAKRSASLEYQLKKGRDFASNEDIEKKVLAYETLEELLTQLPPESAEIIRKKLEGYTLEEIAKQNGLPAKTVEKRHERAMGKLMEIGRKMR